MKIKTIFILTLFFLIIGGISCSKNQENTTSTLFDKDTLILNANATDTAIAINDVENPYVFYKVFDDIVPDSTKVYEIKNDTEVVESDWFKVFVKNSKLHITVKENDTVEDRRFRVIFLWNVQIYPFSITQKGEGKKTPFL